MTLTWSAVLAIAGIDESEALLIRHVYRDFHTDGAPGINANSDDERILAFTANQSLGGKFPAVPPRVWVVFLPESGARARLWRVVVNHGETGRDERSRDFDLEVVDAMADLRNRLVIEWPGQFNWVLPASGKASGWRVLEIADAEPVRYPGFDALILDWDGLQTMVREHRFAAWRTAMQSDSPIVGPVERQWAMSTKRE